MTSNVSASVTTRRAVAADAAALARFATRAFHDTYAADNAPSDMASYAAACFGEGQQASELSDPRVIVFVAERAGEMVGYVMLREGPAPDDVVGGDCIEIARLYAARHLIGSGVGAMLMQRSLDEASRRGRDRIWLGVWEHNARALAFYRRWRFTDVGTLQFMLGNDSQTDRLMTRRVGEEE